MFAWKMNVQQQSGNEQEILFEILAWFKAGCPKGKRRKAASSVTRHPVVPLVPTRGCESTRQGEFASPTEAQVQKRRESAGKMMQVMGSPHRPDLARFCPKRRRR